MRAFKRAVRTTTLVGALLAVLAVGASLIVLFPFIIPILVFVLFIALAVWAWEAVE